MSVKLVLIKQILFYTEKFWNKTKQQIIKESQKNKNKNKIDNFHSTLTISLSSIIISLNITTRWLFRIKWYRSLWIENVCYKLVKEMVCLKRNIDLVSSIHIKHIKQRPKGRHTRARRSNKGRASSYRGRGNRRTMKRWNNRTIRGHNTLSKGMIVIHIHDILVPSL